MLYLARYEIELDNLETAMAKRLEWENVAPESFRVVCEYTIHGQPPPFGGFFVFETDDVQDLNFLVMYYGRTARLDIRPCSDALSALEMTKRNLGAAGPGTGSRPESGLLSEGSDPD